MIRFNHTILPARDAARTAQLTAEILGLPPPRRTGYFQVVDLADDATIDYIDAGDRGAYGHHVAFLVDDASFDAIVARLKERGITYWADPRKAQVNQINHLHGGRGVYFDDLDGNHLECITAPYGRED